MNHGNGCLADGILNREVVTAGQLRKRLDEGADPNAPGRWGDGPLAMAARNLDIESVELLLAAGADPRNKNKTGDTAMHYAAKGQTTKAVVTALAEAGGDVNARCHGGNTPLHCAARYSNGTGGSVVDCLLALGADPLARNDRGETAEDVSETREATDLLRSHAEGKEIEKDTAEASAPDRDRRMVKK